MSKVSPFPLPRRASAALLLLVLVGLGGAPCAFAQPNSHPPERMTYQGYLVDANGTALATNAPKNYDVIFRIWKSESSVLVADRLWTEQQTVTVDKGNFSVLLGEGSSIGEARPDLSTLFTNSTASDRWVGLTVKGIGGGGTDVNILPRLRLLTAPYAFLARSVSGTGVVNATNLAPAIASGLWTANGANVYRPSGAVGIGTSTPDTTLQLGSYGSADQYLTVATAGGNQYRSGMKLRHFNSSYGWTLESDERAGAASLNFYSHFADSAGIPRVSFTGGGGVGIGTQNPGSSLEVNGGIRARGGAPGGSGSLNNGYAFSNGGDTDSGMFSSADGLLQFYTDSIERMRVHPGGNVGIGNSAPAVKLDVAGSMRVDSGGVAAPANGTFGSSGTRLTLWPGDASNPPYAFGIAGGTLWAGVPNSSTHRWYIGTTEKMVLYDGGLSINDGGTGGRLQVGPTAWGDATVNFRQRSGDNVAMSIWKRDGTESLRIEDRVAGGGFWMTVMTGNASKPGGGSWANYSDLRLKKDVRPLEGALDQLLKLRSVTYEYIDPKAVYDTPGRHIGFVAQEVQAVFPDWVSEAKNGYLAVGTKGFESLAVQALRELRAEKDAAVKKLADENAALQATVESQARRLTALEDLIRQKLGGVQGVNAPPPTSPAAK